MSGWIVLVVPVALSLLLGLAATVYLQRVRLPHEETVAGISALAGMRWRDFIQLVLAAMNARGYERVFAQEAGGDEGDYLLERDGQRWLLSSKHGTAYVLGSTSIAEFAREIRMRGATGGLLVTPGSFAPEALNLARSHRIELLDGASLWPELRALLPEEQRAEVIGPPRAQLQRQLLVSWGAALLVGVVAFLGFARARHDEDTRQGAAAALAAPASIATQRAAASARKAPTTSSAPTSAISSDPNEIERRRREIETAVSTLPGIDRAMWSTQSTLLVYLSEDLADPLSGICPLLERYDELAASRVQLQPPPGSKRLVRFVQCRAF